MSRFLLTMVSVLLLMGPAGAWAADGEPAPGEADDAFAYVITTHPASYPKVSPEKLDRVKSGMTLGQIVSLLGKGWMHKYHEGVGIIRWDCQDGRVLSVWPSTYTRDNVIRTERRSNGHGQMWVEKPKDRR